MGKTAIIYARVSTTKQADKDLPVESQIERCEARAAELDATVLKVFRDDGVSGTNGSRRAWQAALLYCETHSVDYFVCWDTKRFARNHVDAVLNKSYLRRIGTELLYASQSFDGEDGWLMEGMFQLFDEHYSRRVGRDTMRSMAKNATDGFWNGGNRPFGFRAVAIGKRKRLEPEPDEVPTVKLIYRWCLEGAGCKDIAVRLNEAGIGKRGRRWDKASVSSVLKCRAAIGQLTFKVGDEEIVTKAHEGIINEEDFMRVQETMKARSPRNVGGRPRSEAVFSGMLRCSCGDAMTTETATGRSGVRYHYYNCRAFLKGIGCRSHRIPVAEFDAWLLGSILDKVLTPANLRGIVRDIRQCAGAWAREQAARLDVLNTELMDVGRRLRRLYDSVEAGAGLELSDIAPRLRELRAKEEDLKRQIQVTEAEQPPETTISEGEVLHAVATYRELVEDCGDPARVRQFLSGFVRRVVLDGGQARIEYFPERIVKTASGGSQCEVRWLPDLATLRTVAIMLPGRWNKDQRAA